MFDTTAQRVLLLIVAAAAFLSYPVAEVSREQLAQGAPDAPLEQEIAVPIGESVPLVSPFVQDEIVFHSSPGFKALLAAADEKDTVRARALLRYGCTEVDDSIVLVMVPGVGRDAAREVQLEPARYVSEAEASTPPPPTEVDEDVTATMSPPNGIVPCPVTLTVPRIPVSETTRGWLIGLGPALDLEPSTSHNANSIETVRPTEDSTVSPEDTGKTATAPARPTREAATDPAANTGAETRRVVSAEQAKKIAVEYRIVRVIGWEGHALLVGSALLVTGIAAVAFTFRRGDGRLEGSRGEGKGLKQWWRAHARSFSDVNLSALPVVTGGVAVFAAISSGTLAWSDLAPDLHLGGILVIALASALLVAISKATDGGPAFALGVLGLALIALLVPLALLHGAITGGPAAGILWFLLVIVFGGAVGWAAAQPATPAVEERAPKRAVEERAPKPPGGAGGM